MPTQGSDDYWYRTSIVVPRVLYDEALRRGYNIRELFKVALIAILKLDDQSLVRYENIAKLYENLSSCDEYKQIIAEAEREAETKKNEQVRVAKKEADAGWLLNLVLANITPTRGVYSSLKSSLFENRLDSEIISVYKRKIRELLPGEYSDIGDTEVLELIRKAVEMWGKMDLPKK